MKDRFPATAEYKRNPELSKESVHQLLKWAHEQKHLPKIAEEDAIIFLSSCLFDIDHAKRTIEFYYTFRSNTPEFYKNRDPTGEKMSHALKHVAIVAIPETTQEGYKVLYTRLMPPADPANFDVYEYIRCLMCLQDILCYEEGAFNGLCIVVDVENLSLRHLLKITPYAVKKLFTYLQYALPARLQSISFAHPVYFMDKLLALIKPFINKNIKDKIFVHSTLECLHKTVPKIYLPKEVGGDLPSVSIIKDISNNKMIEYKDLFIADEKMRVNESLRNKT